MLLFSDLPVTSKAQFIGIFPTPGSCGKCAVKINAFTPQKTGILAFIFFKEDQKADSSDIEEMFEYRKKGFMTIYSDKYCRKINPDPGGVIAVFSEEGNISYQTSLFDFIPEKLDSVFSRLGTNKYKYVPRTNDRFDHNNQYTINLATGKFIWNTKDSSYKYSVDRKDVKKIIATYKELLREPVLDSDLSVNEPGFKPVFSGLDYSPDNAPGRVMVHAKCHYMTVNKTDSDIYIGGFLSEFTNHKHVANWPIIRPANRVLFNDGFVSKGASLYLFSYLEDNDSNQNIIGEWKQYKGAYKFNKMLNVEVPPDMFARTHFNFLSWRCSSFPYLMLDDTRFMTDIANGQRYEISYAGMSDNASEIDTYSDSCKIFNQYLSLAKNNKYLYLTTILNEDKFIQVLDRKSMRRLQLLKLNDAIPGYYRKQYLQPDAQKGIVYFGVNNERIQGFPMELLFPDYSPL